MHRSLIVVLCLFQSSLDDDTQGAPVYGLGALISPIIQK